MNKLVRPIIELSFSTYLYFTGRINYVEMYYACDQTHQNTNYLLKIVENNNDISYHNKGKAQRALLIKRLMLKENKLKNIFKQLNKDASWRTIFSQSKSTISTHILRTNYKYFITTLKILPRFKIIVHNKISYADGFADISDIYYKIKFLFIKYYDYFYKYFTNAHFHINSDYLSSELKVNCSGWEFDHIDIFYYMDYPALYKKRTFSEISDALCKIKIKNMTIYIETELHVY